jgi:hypothetical protein
MKNLYFILIIFTVFGFGQTKYDQYDELILEANSLKNDNKYEQAIEKYKKALNILIPISGTPFFDVADCALKLKKVRLANTFIRKGISEGGAQLSYLLNYEGFNEIQEADFFKKIVFDYNSLRKQYFSTIENIDVYLEIQELIDRDQFVRKIDKYINGGKDQDIANAIKGFQEAQMNNDSIAIKKYQDLIFPKQNENFAQFQRELMRKVDSLNIDKLMEITKVHGWQERAWIILWHQRGKHNEDNYVWNYFRPLINKEIEEGKISRTFWDSFDGFNKIINNLKMGSNHVGEK